MHKMVSCDPSKFDIHVRFVLSSRVCYRARQYRMEATKWAFLADACSMAVVERIWWMALLLKSRIPSLSLHEKHVHAQR